MINTALLSYGMSGEVFHAPLLHVHSEFRLKSILERNSGRSVIKYPYVQIEKDVHSIAYDPDIELVIINTPNVTHFPFAKMMIEAGKHVVLEKPMTTTFAEAQELIKLAKQHRRILTVFQNRRWDGDFLTVKKIVESNVLGDLVEFEARYDRYRPYIEENTWKENNDPGSGLLYNLGSHMIDQALVLFGEPQAVHTDCRIQRKGGKVIDFYNIFLDYKKLRVSLKSSYLVRQHGPRYVLHGHKGSFIKYGIDPQEQDLKDNLQPDGLNWGVEDPKNWGELNTEINGLHYQGKVETVPGNYLAFYDNLYQAVKNGKELAVKPEEAARVVQLIENAS